MMMSKKHTKNKQTNKKKHTNTHKRAKNEKSIQAILSSNHFSIRNAHQIKRLGSIFILFLFCFCNGWISFWLKERKNKRTTTEFNNISTENGNFLTHRWRFLCVIVCVCVFFFWEREREIFFVFVRTLVIQLDPRSFLEVSNLHTRIRISYFGLGLGYRGAS